MIPRIIHQTWKTEILPEKYRNAAAAWRTYHPTWEYKLWTHDTMLAYIKERHHDFLSTYEKFKYPIQRCDAFRYFILDDFGGVYADLDIYPAENIEKYLNTGTDTYVIFNKGGALPDEASLIHNSFFASVPNNPLMKMFQREITPRAPWFAFMKHYHVITTTGSYRVEKALKKSTRPYTILSAELFNSYLMETREYKLRPGIAPVMLAVDADSTWNSWDTKIIKFFTEEPTSNVAPIVIGVGLFILLIALIAGAVLSKRHRLISSK